MNYKDPSMPYVLFVDDEAANRIVFDRTFSDMFRIVMASSGEEALEKMTREVPAVIVCDMRMPGIQGNEVLEIVRERYPDTMRVILSAFTDSGPLLDAINKAQAARYLVKPWDRREMLALLSGAIDAYQLQQRLRTLELQLVKAQRASALGGLVANLAHDMASPISVIVSNVERLSEHAATLKILRDRLRASEGSNTFQPLELEAIEEMPEITHDVADCAEYLASLIKGMRVHSRSQAEEAAIDPRATIHFAAALVRPQVQQRSGTLAIQAVDLPAARIPATQLCQVLVNFLSNAAHSLDRTAAKRRIDVTACPEGGGLEIRIEDTGKGMSAEQLTRLGHDRFTTKASGEGTGLGVAICRALISQWGGKLDIQSEVGVGTKVSLWLPGSDAPAPGEGSAPGATGGQ